MPDCPHKKKKLINDELCFFCSANENHPCIEEYRSLRCPIADEWGEASTEEAMQ